MISLLCSILILFSLSIGSMSQSSSSSSLSLFPPFPPFPPGPFPPVPVTPFGCECSDFKWNNNGVIVGDCQSIALRGEFVCYLHQPNDCFDRTFSRKFPGMQVTIEGCKRGPIAFSAFDGRNPQSAPIQEQEEQEQDGEEQEVWVGMSQDEKGEDLY